MYFEFEFKYYKKKIYVGMLVEFFLFVRYLIDFNN